jgi:hypothetical protein
MLLIPKRDHSYIKMTTSIGTLSISPYDIKLGVLVHHIKSIFDHVGLSYVWNQQNPIHLVELKRTVKQKLTDQFIQKWYNLIATSSRGL